VAWDDVIGVNLTWSFFSLVGIYFFGSIRLGKCGVGSRGFDIFFRNSICFFFFDLALKS
jgi:hypothetical protein